MLERIRRVFGRIVSAETAAELEQITAREPARAETHGGGVLERLAADAYELGSDAHELAGVRGRPTPVADFKVDLMGGVAWTIQLVRDPAAGSLARPDGALWLALLAWLAARGLGGPPDVRDRNRRCRHRLRDWRLDEVVASAFGDMGRDVAGAWRATEMVGAIQELPMWSPARPTADAPTVLTSWFADSGVRRALQLNRDAGVDRFDADAYEEFVVWTTWVAAVRLAEYPSAYQPASQPMLEWVTALSCELTRARVTAGDRVDRLPFARAAKPGPSGA